jgi:hypothetical protein
MKEIKRFGLIEKAANLQLSALHIPENLENGSGERIVILDAFGNELGSFLTEGETDTWADVEIQVGIFFSFHWMDTVENDGEGHSVECYETYEYEDKSGVIYIGTDLQKEFVLKVIEKI